MKDKLTQVLDALGPTEESAVNKIKELGITANSF